MPISTLNTHMNVPTINCLCHGLQTGRIQWLCHPSREQLTWDARAWFFSQCWKCSTWVIFQGKDSYCKGACEVTDFCSKLQLKHAPAAQKNLHEQVIKNIKNVSGCRDTRTAKSKETRGMIEHNSEVYTHPYISFFIVHVYMEEDLCRGDCILHCYVRSSLLFPYFLPFWYPYILIHF